jgi:glyoxylase-like metal-dependent hydrolase (beta-lactamase superfamily II)
MRLLAPTTGILAFYDGREGKRELDQPNWLDDGALMLGIASYAIVDGGEALVYDTHLSVDRARWIRQQLDATKITVVLSHRHIDHIAGTAAFADCEVLAGPLTAKLLGEQREAIEAATPPVKPLVLPTGEVPPTLQVGTTTVQALAFDIHAADHTLLWLPERRILLAADAVEDPITFVAEPDRIHAHLRELDRLEALDPKIILPAHGDPEVIAAGGYSVGIIEATRIYLRALLAGDRRPLEELLKDPLRDGWIHLHPAYEAVHEHNLEAVEPASSPIERSV